MFFKAQNHFKQDSSLKSQKILFPQSLYWPAFHITATNFFTKLFVSNKYTLIFAARSNKTEKFSEDFEKKM